MAERLVRGRGERGPRGWRPPGALVGGKEEQRGRLSGLGRTFLLSALSGAGGPFRPPRALRPWERSATPQWQRPRSSRAARRGPRSAPKPSVGGLGLAGGAGRAAAVPPLAALSEERGGYV